jgi:hypothetical protein
LAGEGRCRRHIIHGRIKYRGSTSGAVIRQREVERRKMNGKEVFIPPSSTIACDFGAGREGVAPIIVAVFDFDFVSEVEVEGVFGPEAGAVGGEIEGGPASVK